MRFLMIIIIARIFEAAYCYPFIYTENGPIRGQTLKSRENRSYYSFTGIPFAKPPIDEYRFKAPEPPVPWNISLDATNPPKPCLQLLSLLLNMTDKLLGDEDCLYLNVYTPNINEKLPVMFWIHGGGFVVGQSGPALYGPEYFMDKNVVLVTSNYRLGLLGFLSTEDDVIPGNYGLKDQVLALRWVKENIRQFGGDPDHVTIFGESAGSASVGYHLLSPLSKGLFHKAIMQSGSPLCKWAIAARGVAFQRAKRVANMAGCKTDTSHVMLKCLRSLKASVITQMYPDFFEWVNNPLVTFPPTVENCRSDAFICVNPLVKFQQESNVPVIIGVNSAEGGLIVAPMYNDSSLLYPEFKTDFIKLVSIVLMYKDTALPEDTVTIGEKLLKKYFSSGRVEDQSHLEAVKMFGDGFFVDCSLDMAVKLSSRVYFYLFDHQNEFSFNKVFGKCQKPLGVTHGDDLNLLFNIKQFNKGQLNDVDTEVSKTMINIWTQFAAMNLVTIDGTSYSDPWPAFSTINDSLILQIDSPKPKLIRNPFEEIYTFWQNLPFLTRILSKVKKNADAKNEL